MLNDGSVVLRVLTRSDLTPGGAAKRAKRHLTAEEAKRYMNESWRMRVIKYANISPSVAPSPPARLTAMRPTSSVWKPFSTVEDWDLVCCDYSTVQSQDLAAVDRVSSEYVGEVYMLKPRTHYRWYRLDHQRHNEATIFMSYDSAPGSGAPCK